jgi:hypothetical protein
MTNTAGWSAITVRRQHLHPTRPAARGWNYGQVEDFAGPLSATPDSGAIANTTWATGSGTGASRHAPGRGHADASRMTPGVLYVTSPNLDGVYYPGRRDGLGGVLAAGSPGDGIPYITLRLEGATRNAYTSHTRAARWRSSTRSRTKTGAGTWTTSIQTALVLNGGVIRYSTSPNRTST